MYRFLRRRRNSGFHASDILRLMAMIGMLGVLGMTFLQFRDARMWRWMIRSWESSQGAEADEIARLKQIEAQAQALAVLSPKVVLAATDEIQVAEFDEQDEPQKADEPKEAKPEKAQAETPQTIDPVVDSAAATKGISQNVPGGNERPDPAKAADDAKAGAIEDDKNSNTVKRSELIEEEAALLKQELEIVEDKTPLDRLEMGAYWRLVGWVRDQTSEEMGRRARRDILFTHLWERPSKYRGQLVRLKLHLVRSLRYEPDKNRLGVKWLYEAWGTTNDSASNPFVVVFTDWPKGMPLGEGLEEEATVDGYFLKLMRYNSRDGKVRSAPLLIGRVNWHNNPVNAAQNSSNVIWSGLVIVCGVVVIGLGVWVFRFAFASPKLPVLTPAIADSEAVGSWLADSEDEAATPDVEKVASSDT